MKSKIIRHLCFALVGTLFIFILLVAFVFPNEFSGISFELESDLIESSSDLVGEISINTSHNFQTIKLIIFHENGAEVYKEYIILEDEKLIWNYYDLGKLPEGKYIAVLRIVTHEKFVKDFGQDFEIRKEVRGITGETINFVKTDGKTYGSLVVLVLSLVFLWFVIKKKISREK
jgi:hypothetical protein